MKSAGVQATPATTGIATLAEGVPLIIDASGDYFARLTAIHRLPANLAEPEVKEIFRFLTERSAEDEQQRGQVLKNDLMDVLVENPSISLPLSQNLVHLLEDASQNIVIRDYALQHLFTLFERLGDAPQRQEVLDTREALRTTFRNALGEKDSSIAGTALVGLARLANQSSEFSKAQIGADALRLVRDENVGELTRISALQVCGQLNQVGAAAYALALAERGTTVSIQISAIGTLGMLGGPGEATFLERFTKGENERLRPAAATALQTLKRRLETSPEVNRKQSGV